MMMPIGVDTDMRVSRASSIIIERVDGKIRVTCYCNGESVGVAEKGFPIGAAFRIDADMGAEVVEQATKAPGNGVVRLSAKVIRGDGTIEDLGVISENKDPGAVARAIDFMKRKVQDG